MVDKLTDWSSYYVFQIRLQENKYLLFCYDITESVLANTYWLSWWVSMSSGDRGPEIIIMRLLLCEGDVTGGISHAIFYTRNEGTRS